MENNTNIKSNLYFKYKSLIHKVIRDLNCQYKTQDEYQEYYDYGEIGLLIAIDKFDLSKKDKISYFYKCIKRSLIVLFKYKNYYKRKINYLMLLSLEDKINDNIHSLQETIEDNNINIENAMLIKENKELLFKAISKLKPTYRDIIFKYYGIYGKRYTLQELADIYHISRQAINVKKDNALKKLKEIAKKIGVDKDDLQLYN